jgi:hypothetical protein
MQRDKEKDFGYINPIRPKRGLFSRIMKRLGLEIKLRVVKKYLGFCIIAFIIFAVLFGAAFIVLKQLVAESNLGAFLSLIFSDPQAVLKYWDSFALSILESIPGFTAFVFLLSTAFLLLLVRAIILYFEKLLSIIKSIRKQRYEHK